ncbi:MAG: ABC transporter permease [Desulfobulbaceae bacterium]|nr:ABC transporter permease [Candidatus Kapabacteria bacterium]MBS4001570.1 ABC transporter permease [Desulfobulbaceae bacterium]
MKFEYFIALRYIFAKRSFNFITVITVLSIIGITVGVAALIVVLSIFNGFQNMTKKQFLGFDPHIRIVPKEGNWFDPKELTKQIAKIEMTESIVESYNSKVIGFNNNQVQVFELLAVDSKKEDFYQGIKRATIFGKFNLETDNPRLPGIVVGNVLADKLRVLPGDTLMLLSPRSIEKIITGVGLRGTQPAVVTGIFNSNIKDYDSRFGISSDILAKSILNPKIGFVNSIDLRIKDIKHLDVMQSQLSVILPNDLQILTWQDLNPDLFAIMKFERFVTFAVLSIIIMLAVFNVLISLSMTVIEKRRDIGVLRSLGASGNAIRNIFVYQGVIIGFVSTVIGTALGLFVSFGQINYKWLKVDSSKFIIDAIPLAVDSADVWIIAAFSLILSTIATIYPARRASDMDIIGSIRTE